MTMLVNKLTSPLMFIGTIDDIKILEIRRTNNRAAIRMYTRSYNNAYEFRVDQGSNNEDEDEDEISSEGQKILEQTT